MQQFTIKLGKIKIPVYQYNTVVLGSGSAALNAADRLHQYGQTDLAIVTEQVGGGTSNNTGSDKQTYYKMSVFGAEPDSPLSMAETLFGGGAMHGDIAMAEAIGSLPAFFHLAAIGVKFPYNQLGGFVGYKTDHDPRQRATSAGPWTSQQMVQCLLSEVQRRQIPIHDNQECVALVVENRRVLGLLTINTTQTAQANYGLTLFMAENVVFGVGGPGGLYKTSAYPLCHNGAIGLALEAGATAQNLTESQFGLASIGFRWNVSGTYQQVVPRYISTAADGSDEREFLNHYFPSMGLLATDIFLKGYQWPFDPRKIENLGSSIIDVLVYIEAAVRGRRVFMDFRANPRGGNGLGPFRLKDLRDEARLYLEKSGALQATPIERLAHMNPLAIELYERNGINLHTEPLEVAVCAQHNNGGLTGDVWWESDIAHLFPVGEVNGSHGIYRPGGSALNSGQVGSWRAAQKIAYCYRESTFSTADFERAARHTGTVVLEHIEQLLGDGGRALDDYREEFQARMTAHGSHIRELNAVESALRSARAQIASFDQLRVRDRTRIAEALRVRHLLIAHEAYLEAIATYLRHGGGSRGSYMVMGSAGNVVHESLAEQWRYEPENRALREQVLETVRTSEGTFASRFVPRRPLPRDEYWFESTWGEYLRGATFGCDQ